MDNTLKETRKKIKEEKAHLANIVMNSTEDEERESAIKKLEAISEAERLLDKNDKDNSIKIEYIKLGLEAAGIILPMGFYTFWLFFMRDFEVNGTPTSSFFRSFGSKISPRKL